MKIIGIAGGVGAGKSTILKVLERDYQALVIASDEVARSLQKIGGSCYEPMLELFGRDCVLPDGNLDRARIAGIVFNDAEMLKKLNAIVHPRVSMEIERLIGQAREEGRRYCVLESAILFETGYEKICDEVWQIYTDPEIRIGRLMESRGYSRERCISMMKGQMSDEELEKRCQVKIDNSCSEEDTKQQIDKILAMC